MLPRKYWRFRRPRATTRRQFSKSLLATAIASRISYARNPRGFPTGSITPPPSGPLVILTPTTLPSAQQGFPYKIALPVALGIAPYTATLVSQTGSNSWTLSSPGLLQGVPSNATTDTITVSFIDSTPGTPLTTGNVVFTITTIAVGGSLVSVSGSTFTAPNATPGGSYVLPLTPLFTGGLPPYTFQAGSGSVTGASGTVWQSQVSGNDSLQGAPATGTSGTDSVSVTCTDCLGATATVTISIPISSTLVFQGIPVGSTSGQPLPTAMVGNVYGTTNFGYPFRAAGGSGTGYTFSTVSGLPPGLGITGTLATGTPTTAGTYNWAVKVTDSASNTATYTFMVTVLASQNVTPPAWCTGSNKAFFCQSGQIYDWTGAPFRARGVNIAHYDQNWHSGTPASPNGLATTRSNCARIFVGQTFGASWTTLAADIAAITTYKAVAIPTIPFTLTAFGNTNGTKTSGSAVPSVFQDAVNQWVTAAPFLLSMNSTIWIDIANEFENFGTTQWAQFYSAIPATAIASISGNTITLASSVTGATNPFAGNVVGYVQGGTGGTQFVGITATGGTSGAWTITASPPAGGTLTSSTGGTIVGGGIGVIRALGFTCPIFLDSGTLVYITPSIMQGIINSDPLQNVIFNVHLYGSTVNIAAAITNVTTGGSATISYKYPPARMAGASQNPMRASSPTNPFNTFWNNFEVYGVQGTTSINTSFTSSPPSGQTGGSYTQSTPITTTGTYSGGGWMFVTAGPGELYFKHQMAQNAVMMNLGLPMMVGEFGGCSPPNNQTPTTWDPAGNVALAAEYNQMGWLDWAFDDNGGSGANGGFILTQGSPNVGIYTKPTDLNWNGVDIILHPTYGITALATPASALI